LLLKFELHPVQKIKQKSTGGLFFNPINESLPLNTEDLYPLTKIAEGYNFFSSSYRYFEKNIPNWHKNYFNNSKSNFKNSQWWEIPDFDPEVGDIKAIWELSRFEWVVQLALLASTGKNDAINLLNDRLNHWIEENHTYKGVNWKCGQESSIRLMHLIIAAIILNQHNSPTKPLLELIEIHLRRISPTISYAIAQNNNHGTSEAAALFIGGHFLSNNGLTHFRKYEKIGRKYLEERCSKLFSNNGCFSQYSVNYHRLALDTYCFCETYRIKNNLPSFTNALYSKIQKAITWLEILTDKDTGDAPNIGANDGARILNIFNLDYRDFRSSVQWSNLVFNKRMPYKPKENELILFKQLGINIIDINYDNPIDKKEILGSDDGFFIYKKNNVLLVFKRPIYNFRPSHSDSLHVDLWINGVNILRDGGSLSYNTTFEKVNYYSGTFSHNTVLFDSRNQMKKISRFLFGSWLKEQKFSYEFSDNNIKILSGYRDAYGVSHTRTVVIKDHLIQIIDFVNGFKDTARLIFRLPAIKWNENKNIQLNDININTLSSEICGNFIINNEYESRYYNSETSIPVISKLLVNNIQHTTNLTF